MKGDLNRVYKEVDTLLKTCTCLLLLIWKSSTCKVTFKFPQYIIPAATFRHKATVKMIETSEKLKAQVSVFVGMVENYIWKGKPS